MVQRDDDDRDRRLRMFEVGAVSGLAMGAALFSAWAFGWSGPWRALLLAIGGCAIILALPLLVDARSRERGWAASIIRAIGGGTIPLLVAWLVMVPGWRHLVTLPWTTLRFSPVVASLLMLIGGCAICLVRRDGSPWWRGAALAVLIGASSALALATAVHLYYQLLASITFSDEL